MLSAVYAVVVCRCMCVCVGINQSINHVYLSKQTVSDTLRYCIKTAKRRITQITPHDSALTLVF